MIRIKNKYYFVSVFPLFLVLCFLLLSVNKIHAVNTPATLSGNDGWTDSGANWSGGGGASGAPDADDDVIIAVGVTLTMNTNFTTTGSVLVTGSGAVAQLVFSGHSLTCGAFTVNSGSGGNTNLVTVGTGTLTCTSISMDSQPGRAEIDIGTGTVTVSGNITLAGNAGKNSIVFTGAGLLQLSGTWTTGKTFTSFAGCTVEFTSAGAQNITTGYTYNNVICSGAGTKSLQSAETIGGNFTINGCTVNYSAAAISQVVTGNLIINNNGKLDLNQNTATFTSANISMNGTSTIDHSAGTVATVTSNATLTVAAAATALISNDIIFKVNTTSAINGGFTMNNGTSTKTFIGKVTIANTGTWTSTAVTTTGNLVFRGGIQHDNTTASTFSAGGATFNTNSQIVSGAGVLNFANIVTVTGAAVVVTNNTTVNITANAAAQLTGTGKWTQGSNSTLNYTGTTITIANLDASASGNTVSYNNGAANQTVFATVSNIYFHLILDNTTGTARTKTLSATADINGNLTISATASTGNTIFSASTFDITLAGDWTNNSTNATPFTTGTRKVTFDGTANQNITGSAATTFYDLTLNNTGVSGSDKITLGKPTTVSDILTLTDGILNTDATNVLTITNTATTAATAGNSTGPSFVSGPMTWSVTSTASTYVFPTGKGSTKWARVGVVAPNAAGAFTCEYFNSAPSNRNSLAVSLKYVSGLEYWDAARTSGTATAQIKLFWELNTSSGITTCTNLALAHYTGGNWQSEGSTGCSFGAAGFITGANVLSTFSPFTFGDIANEASGVNPLPIELLVFNAKANGNVVDLNWTTASEVNNDFFTIEKTTDGVNFEVVGKVKGAGNSTSVINYSSVDNTPLEPVLSGVEGGVRYYRLKQTDYDGHISYSDLKMVRFEKNADFSFNIYPNPNDGNTFNLEINANKNEEVLVVLYDVFGKEIYSKVLITKESDNNVYAIDTSQKLPSGVYMISATSNDNIYHKRLIVN